MQSNNYNSKGIAFKIVARCRPTIRNNYLEQQGIEIKQILSIDESKKQITMLDPNSDPSSKQLKKPTNKIFSFDKVFGPEDDQQTIYSEIGHQVVESALEGYNGTIFAYGQTSTGKTYTMQGGEETFEQRGIIPRACEHIQNFIQENPQIQYIVKVSHVEIYNENVIDLLSKTRQPLEIRENPITGVFVENLSNFVVSSKQEIINKMNQGFKNRCVSSTMMNSSSSRGHYIFQIVIQRYDEANPEQSLNVGTLRFVDLSGSERLQMTGATGQTLKEAIKINQSLSMLGNVMTALTSSKSAHIPYRNSKLTRLLQNSLGGNSKTTMISTVGMNDRYYEETLNTLRFSERAKLVKNLASVNRITQKELIQSFREEYSSIRESRSNSIVSISNSNNQDIEERKSISSQPSLIFKEDIIANQNDIQDLSDYEII